MQRRIPELEEHASHGSPYPHAELALGATLLVIDIARVLDVQLVRLSRVGNRKDSGFGKHEGICYRNEVHCMGVEQPSWVKR